MQIGEGRSGWFALASFVLVLACSGAKNGSGEPEPGSVSPNAATQPVAEEPLELGPITKTSFREHPAGVAWVFDDGEPRSMDIGAAEARGYTIVDLSNGWVPYIFSEKTPGAEDGEVNKYRATYIGLANDRINAYGDELAPYEHNHLELYGIPPSLAVIFAEWQSLATEVLPCLEESGYDPTIFSQYQGIIAYRDMNDATRRRNGDRARRKLATAMRRRRLDIDSEADLAKAAQEPKLEKLYAAWRSHLDEVEVITQAQKRFSCERLYNTNEGRGNFTPGAFDSATTHALANFEKKHDLMGWGHFKRDNLALLAKTPEEVVHERLLRAVEERVVTSSGIVEDGSAARWRSKFRWKDKDGNEHELRNLVEEFTTAAVQQLGLQTLESAREQLTRLSDLGKGNFEELLVAVKMPALPEYYGENMQFSAVIDRGDVWYDFPYDDQGNEIRQKRKRYPHLTLYVKYLDQDIPLVHWRTTIGSWRNELVDGQVMLKYKNSDIGERVWKDIVAAPVWIPPTTTPPKALITKRRRRGKLVNVVNYDETGPGYASAYGLVAAYHIRQVKDEAGNVTAEIDNAIRTHGSVDYMSILRRYSHGCHRLYNMDAVRMFSFILQRRDHQRKGQQPVGLKRPFEWEEETFELEIDTRGYKYELVEPIPVVVTKGNILGERKRPIFEAMHRPVPPGEAEDLLETLENAFGGAQEPSAPDQGQESTSPASPAEPGVFDWLR